MPARTPQTPAQSALPMLQPRTPRKRKSDDSSAHSTVVHVSPSKSKKRKQTKSESQKSIRDAQSNLDRKYYRDYEPLYDPLQAMGTLTLPEKVKAPQDRQYRRYAGPWRQAHLNTIHDAVHGLNRIRASLQPASNIFNVVPPAAAAAAAASTCPAAIEASPITVGGTPPSHSAFPVLGQLTNVNHSITGMNDVNSFQRSNPHVAARGSDADTWYSLPLTTMSPPAPNWLGALGPSATPSPLHTPWSPAGTPLSTLAGTSQLPVAGSPPRPHQIQQPIEADDPFQQLWHPQPRQASSSVGLAESILVEVDASLAATAIALDMPVPPPPQPLQLSAITTIATQEPIPPTHMPSSSSTKGFITPPPAPAPAQGPVQEPSAPEGPSQVAGADVPSAEAGFDALGLADLVMPDLDLLSSYYLDFGLPAADAGFAALGNADSAMHNLDLSSSALFDFGPPAWEVGWDDSDREFWAKLLGEQPASGSSSDGLGDMGQWRFSMSVEQSSSESSTPVGQSNSVSSTPVEK